MRSCRLEEPDKRGNALLLSRVMKENLYFVPLLSAALAIGRAILIGRIGNAVSKVPPLFFPLVNRWHTSY